MSSNEPDLSETRSQEDAGLASGEAAHDSRTAAPTQTDGVLDGFRQQVEGDAGPGPGNRLGQYLLHEKLGQGGMGSVFAATRDGSSQRVALKVLERTLAARPSAVKRFHKEGLLLKEADSLHVTRLLDVSDEQPHPFIVTELIEGPTLSEFMKGQQRLSERVALQLAAQVAQALTDIAELGIIHRDIKPDNILLARNPEKDDDPTTEFIAKLSDFGLARHTEQSQSMAMTRETALLGTPLYMSPEQFTDIVNLDARSDIYSLGATLFHMLAGHPPFPSRDIAKLAEMHRHSPAPDLRTSVSTASDAVSEVIRKCLQKRPDLRYQTAADLRNDLCRVIDGEPVSIAAHPLIPESDRRNVLSFRNEWELSSTPEQLWPFVSNTERLNRAIGLPAVRYTTEVIDDVVHTSANVRIAGMTMKWREHVFEWIEARRMGVLREFESGPLKWFTSTVEFVSTVDGHTHLIHRFQVEPRNLFGRLFARFKFGVETKRSLTNVYQRIDTVLRRTRGKDPLVDAFEDVKPLSARQQLKFDQTLTTLQRESVDRDTLFQLVEFAQHGPAQEVGRMRPIRLAERLQVSFDRLLEALLRGTRAGMFELKWDVICPSCRLASQTYDLLQMVSDHENCEACNVQFEVDLRNQVESIFRVHPQLRDVDTGKYCIGGPAHSPHVVAQTRIRPEESVQLALSLAAGTYVVRGPQLATQLKFQVVGEASTESHSGQHGDAGGDGATDKTTIASRHEILHTMEMQRHQLTLNLAEPSDWNEADISLAGGQQLVELYNGFERETIVRIERASPRADAMTAAAMLATPLFRELFPGQTLAKSQLAAVSRMTLLQTDCSAMGEFRSRIGDAANGFLQEHLQELARACSQHNGTWIKIVGHGAVMAFVSHDDAVACANEIVSSRPSGSSHEWTAACAIVTGQTAVTTIHGQLDYLGEPVEVLHKLLHNATAGEVVSRVLE